MILEEKNSSLVITKITIKFKKIAKEALDQIVTFIFAIYLFNFSIL